jgi:hypothetical protein
MCREHDHNIDHQTVGKWTAMIGIENAEGSCSLLAVSCFTSKL